MYKNEVGLGPLRSGGLGQIAPLALSSRRPCFGEGNFFLQNVKRKEGCYMKQEIRTQPGFDP
jgi:hypothetical protein